VVRSYSYGPHTLPSWDSFRASPSASSTGFDTPSFSSAGFDTPNFSSAKFGGAEQNGNFLPPHSGNLR
jgi:hypothetical protein